MALLHFSNCITAATSFEDGVAAWTIRGALLCMVFFFAIRLSKSELEGTTLDVAKSLWLVGSLLSLLHAIATMAFYHQFQHDLAYADTAEQTRQAIGIAIGFGIWLNYAFVLVWIIDALWLNGFTTTYLSRHRSFDWLIYGFLAFIAFNGAIVFESGPVRWVGLLSVLILVSIWAMGRASRIRDGYVDVANSQSD